MQDLVGGMTMRMDPPMRLVWVVRSRQMFFVLRYSESTLRFQT